MGMKSLSALIQSFNKQKTGVPPFCLMLPGHLPLPPPEIDLASPLVQREQYYLRKTMYLFV